MLGRLEQWHEEHDTLVGAGIDRDVAVQRADAELARRTPTFSWAPGERWMVTDPAQVMVAHGPHKPGLAAAFARAEAALHVQADAAYRVAAASPDADASSK